MKNYLQAYVSYTQDNWVDSLPIAEFAANNHVNASTRMTLFFANYGFHPWAGIEPAHTYGGVEQKAELLAADRIVARQEKMLAFLKD